MAYDPSRDPFFAKYSTPLAGSAPPRELAPKRQLFPAPAPDESLPIDPATAQAPIDTGLGAGFDSVLNFADRYISKPAKSIWDAVEDVPGVEQYVLDPIAKGWETVRPALDIANEVAGQALTGGRWAAEDAILWAQGADPAYKRLVEADRRKEVDAVRAGQAPSPTLSEASAAGVRQIPSVFEAAGMPLAVDPAYGQAFGGGPDAAVGPSGEAHGAGQTATGAGQDPTSFFGMAVQAGVELPLSFATDPVFGAYVHGAALLQKAQKLQKSALEAARVAGTLEKAGVVGAEQQVIGAQKLLRTAQQADIATGVPVVPDMAQQAYQSAESGLQKYEEQGGFTPSVFEDTLGVAIPLVMGGMVGADVGRVAKQGYAQVPKTREEAQALIAQGMSPEELAQYQGVLDQDFQQRSEQALRESPDQAFDFPQEALPLRLDLPPVDLADQLLAEEAQRPIQDFDEELRPAPPQERVQWTPEQEASYRQAFEAQPGQDFSRAVFEATQQPPGAPRLVDQGVQLSPAASAAARLPDIERQVAGPLLDEAGGDPLAMLRTLGGETPVAREEAGEVVPREQDREALVEPPPQRQALEAVEAPTTPVPEEPRADTGGAPVVEGGDRTAPAPETAERVVPPELEGGWATDQETQDSYRQVTLQSAENKLRDVQGEGVVSVKDGGQTVYGLRGKSGKIQATAVINERGALTDWAGTGAGTGLVLRKLAADNPNITVPFEALSASSARALQTAMKRPGKVGEFLRQKYEGYLKEQGVLDTAATLTPDDFSGRSREAGRPGGVEPGRAPAGEAPAEGTAGVQVPAAAPEPVAAAAAPVPAPAGRAPQPAPSTAPEPAGRPAVLAQPQEGVSPLAPARKAENLAAFREAIDGLTLADVDAGAIVRVKELRKALQNILPGEAFDQFLDQALKGGDLFVGSRLKDGRPKEVGLSKAGIEQAKQVAGPESGFEEAARDQARADAGITRKAPAPLKLAEVEAGSRIERGRKALQSKGDAALARLRAPKGPMNDIGSAGWEATKAFADVVTLGAARIATRGLDFATWSKEMVEALGDRITPYLEKVFEKAHEFIRWRDELYAPERSKRPELANYALRGVADRYAKKYQIDLDLRTNTHAAFDPMRARRIADAYEAMLHEPNDPRVQASYEALTTETKQQWDHLQEEGYVLEPWTQEGQPYNSSVEMRADVSRNKHLYFFQGGDLPADHPLAQRTGVMTKAGELTFNDMFRAVHDSFAHAKEGFEFGQKGEESAWREHYMMFSPDARPAMTTETRGQNSWVNFGRHLQTPWGAVPQRGEPGYMAQTERPYAQQKAGLLPLEFISQEVPKRKKIEPEVLRELRPEGTSVPQIAAELNRYSLKRWGAYTGQASEKAVARAVKIARKEIEYQLEQMKTGVAWYTKDISDMEGVVKQLHPDLEDANRMTLFKTVIAATSFGNRPDLNLDTALKVWQEFKSTGKFPARNPENGKNWPGNPGFGTGDVQTAQKKLQQLVDERGVDGAAEFLRGFQPISELRKYNKTGVSGKASESKRGFDILGPKGGPFAGNLHGIHENLTADMWFSRTWNRWMGTLIDAQGGTVDAPTTLQQRQEMKEAIEQLADEFNLTTADTQAVLWYYEQQLYKALGARIEEGSYAAAAKKALDKRGGGKQLQLPGLGPEREAGPDTGAVRAEDAGEGGEAAGRREDATLGERAEEAPAGEGQQVEAQLAQALDRHAEDGSFSWLDQLADEASARLKQTSATMEAGGLLRIPDLALVGARLIRDGARTIGDFTTKLVETFGGGISGLIRQVWDGALRLLRSPGTSSEAAAPQVGGRAGAQPIPTPGTPGRGQQPSVPPGGGTSLNPPGSPAPVGRSSPLKPKGKVFNPRGAAPDFSQVFGEPELERATNFEGAPQVGKPSPAPGEPETNVNVSRISSNAEITELTSRLVESSPEVFGKVEGGARGATRDWSTVRRLAIKLGLDGDGIIRNAEKKGGYLSDVELEAANIAHEEIARRAIDATNEIARFRAAGKVKDASDAETLYAEHITKLAALRYTMIQAKSEAARTLALSRKLGEGLTPEERAYRVFVTAHKKLGPQFQKQFYDAVTNNRWKDVNKLTRKAFDPTWMHMLTEGWKAGLFSGPKTHVVNFASNGTHVIGILPVDALVSGVIDEVYSKAKGIPDAERVAFAGESVAMLKGAHAGVDKAWTDLKLDLQAIKDGTFEDRQTAAQIRNNEEIHGRQAIPGKFGVRMRTPFQMLTAGDNFWKDILRSQHLYREAYRAGRKRSLKGTSLEGFTKDYIDQYAMSQHPQQDFLRASMEKSAKYGTFQQDMPSWGRKIGEFISDHPIASFVLPTVKTPVNLVGITLQHTPVGYFQARSEFNAGKITKEEFVDKLGRATMGTALMAAMYLLLDQTDLEITGGGPADFKAQAALRDGGWQPYAVRIPGTDVYIPYQRNDPMSGVLGMVADAHEMKDAKGATEKLEKGVMLVMENLLNKTFLAGLSGFAAAVRSPKQYGMQFAKQLAGSFFPMTGLVGTLNRATDPNLRQVDSIGDAWKANIPGLSQTLPVKYSVTGEERMRMGGEGIPGGLQRMFNPFTVSQLKHTDSAELTREMVRINKLPSPPPKDLPVSGGKRMDLTPEEQALYAAEYEKAARTLARTMRNTTYWNSLPDTDDDATSPGQMTKERVIYNVYRDARARVRGQLYQKPQFRRDAERVKRGLEREQGRELQ